MNLQFLADVASLDKLSLFEQDLAHASLIDGGLGIPDLLVRSESGYSSSFNNSKKITEFVIRNGYQPVKAQLVLDKQGTIANKMNLRIRDRILAELSAFPEEPERLVALAEFAEPVARAVWRVLPLDNNHIIPTASMVTLLRERFLLPPSAKTCRLCFRNTSLGHNFVCEGSRNKLNQRRHDELVQAFKTVFSTPALPCRTEVEAPDARSQHRMDLVISGPRAKNGEITNMDITVASYYSESMKAMLRRIQRGPDEEMWAFARRLMYCARQVAEQEKMDKYIGRFMGEFVPLVFLPNGHFDAELAKWIRTPGWMLKIASILARAKTSQ